MELYDLLERLTYVVDAAIDLRDQARVRADSAEDGITDRLKDYAEELDEYRKDLVNTAGAYVSGEEKLRENLGELYGRVNGYDGRPTNSELRRKEILEVRLEEAVNRFVGLTSPERIGSLNSRLERAGLQPLELRTREEWEERKD